MRTFSQWKEEEEKVELKKTFVSFSFEDQIGIQLGWLDVVGIRLKRCWDAKNALFENVNFEGFFFNQKEK